MTESHSSLFVFLSYSHNDKKTVTQLKGELQQQGITIWIDHESIQVGTRDWEEAVRKAIRTASAVVMVASPNARNSLYVKDELRIAEMYQRPVYPFWIAGEQWMEAVPIGLGGMQFIDAREGQYEQAVLKLVKVLAKPAAPLSSLDDQADEEIPISQFITPPHGVLRNPYKGLNAFRSKDAGDFFGRDRLVEELVETVRKRLAPAQHGGLGTRPVMVFGPSGSGKSSVVMAGLIPQLQRGILPGSQEWVYLEPMKPGKDPIEALAHALSLFFPTRSFQAIREDLEDDSARGLHRLSTSLTKRLETKVVLLIDQFEELFTQTTSESERQRFFNLLVTAMNEPQSSLLVLLTLRADFYDRLMQYQELFRVLDAHRVSVLPMEYKDLRCIIEEPAHLPDVQIIFEGDLVGDLLFEVRGQSSALPLLQFTLAKLFERKKGHLLTQQAYYEIGGVKGALAKHAEETYAALPSEEHRKLAQTLFVRLIDPGVTQQDTTRRRAVLSEFLLPDLRLTELLQETMDAFISARLLVTNKVGGSTTIEVSHEALIGEWGRLAQWIKETRENLPFQQTLSKDVALWEQLDKPKERLYYGSQLKLMKKRVDYTTLNQQEVLFLHASAVNQKQQRIKTIPLLLLPVIILGLVLTPLLVFRPSWCPSWLCPAPQVLLDKEGTHDSNLQVTFQTLQSSNKVIPGDPSTYTLGNLPIANDAQLINTHQALPYRVVLKIHSLQQGRFGLVIDQVTLVVTRQAQVIPYPLRVWIADNVLPYNNNLYRVTYRGQATNTVLSALYVAQPLAHVSLLPGETDELSLEVRSTLVADLHFQVQVTYQVIGQLVSHALTLANVFGVIFSDPANWHPYHLQDGHLAPAS